MTDKKTRITMIVLHDQAAAIEQLLNTMILATLHDADDDMSIMLNRKSQLRAIRDLVRNFKRSVYQPTAEALEDWNDDLRSRDDEAIRE